MSVWRSVREHFVLPAGHGHGACDEHFVDDEGTDGARADPAPRAPARRRAPALRDARAAGADVIVPPAVAVLSAARDAYAIAAALGLALARGRRTRIAIVCVWTPDGAVAPVWRAPAMPAARALAASLRERGHAAQAAGRLVVARLPAAPADAALHARRVAAAAGAAPTVLALGGPRMPDFDALLGEQDLVVIAPPCGTEPVLGRLALAGLDAPNARTCVCELPPAPPARALAAGGVLLLPALRRALAGVLAELS
jgi:hypothetical protein